MLKITEDSNNIELEKIKQYEEYVEEHYNNVKKAFEELINKEIPETMEYLNDLYKKVQEHDNSKWSEEEFNAYRKNFYPINEQEKEDNKEEFEKAWKHHYENNDHHWEHWLDDQGSLESLIEVGERNVRLAYLEMVCDWTAMRI